MYTLYKDTGEVFRDSDSVLIAPTSDPTNADYQAYIAYVESGNQPVEGVASPTLLAKHKTDLWELIKKERDRRKSEGGYKVGTSWFHSDDTSRIQQMALVMLGASMPAGIMWKTMSNDFVLMTPTLAGQIFQAALASDMAIFTIAEQKKAAMLASADPGNYDYLSGWPKIYGE